MKTKPTIKKSDKIKKISTQKIKNSSSEKTARIPGIDKGKVIIMPDFDKPLPEFET